MPYIYKERRPPEPWREYRKRSRHVMLHPYFLVEWACEWCAFFLSQWAVLEVLEYAGSLSILFGVIIYFAEAHDRLEQKHYQAWLVIDSAQGKSGNGGRLNALQELNSDGVPLVNVDISDAYLRGIDLHGADLSRSDMSGADMRDAVLNGANLSDAGMVYTNLRSASLKGANFNRVDLKRADLTGADVSGVDFNNAVLFKADLGEIRNWKSIMSMSGANIFGVQNPPDGFVDWAKQQGAIEDANVIDPASQP